MEAGLREHALPFAPTPQPLRSMAAISTAQQLPGDGYLLHPAITDACMQLGPMAGVAQAAAPDLSGSGTPNTSTLTLETQAPAHHGPARRVTRVVAGLAVLQAGGGRPAGDAAGGAERGAAAWAAGALGRPLLDGSTCSSHWLLSGALAIDDLQVVVAINLLQRVF